MFLPKEKIIFAVDFNALGAVPSRLAVNDSYPVEWEDSLKRTLALDWERQIPGHPGPGGRLGTQQDMEQQLAFMTDLSAEVKKASDAGKCFDPATKEVRAAAVRDAAGLRAEHRMEHPPLVRLLGAGDLRDPANPSPACGRGCGVRAPSPGPLPRTRTSPAARAR